MNKTLYILVESGAEIRQSIGCFLSEEVFIGDEVTLEEFKGKKFVVAIKNSNIVDDLSDTPTYTVTSTLSSF